MFVLGLEWVSIVLTALPPCSVLEVFCPLTAWFWSHQETEQMEKSSEEERCINPRVFQEFIVEARSVTRVSASLVNTTFIKSQMI